MVNYIVMNALYTAVLFYFAQNQQGASARCGTTHENLIDILQTIHTSCLVLCDLNMSVIGVMN